MKQEKILNELILAKQKISLIDENYTGLDDDINEISKEVEVNKIINSNVSSPSDNRKN
jgi:hypothetical protein